MSPFLAGALGALALVVTLGVARRLVWFRRIRRWRAGGPLPVRHLAARLKLRPDQEGVLTTQLEALWGEASQLKADGRALREDLAALLSAESLDAAQVSATLDARLGRLDALRARLAEGLARVHATLDAEQRTRVAALVRSGPGLRRHGHGRC